MNTNCNRCTFEYFKRRAKEEGKIIVTQSGGIGTLLFMVPGDVNFEALPKGNWDKRTGKMGYCVADMMTLPDHCHCPIDWEKDLERAEKLEREEKS
jgi:hypothetical protein